MNNTPRGEKFRRRLATTLTLSMVLALLSVETGVAGVCSNNHFANAASAAFLSVSHEKRGMLISALQDCPANPGTLVRLGQLYEVEGDLDKAEGLYNRVVAGMGMTGSVHVNQILAMGGLAAVMEKRHRLLEARDTYESSLEKLRSGNLRGLQGMESLEQFFITRLEDIQSAIRRNNSQKNSIPLMQTYGSIPKKASGIEFVQEKEHKSKAAYSATESVERQENKSKAAYNK